MSFRERIGRTGILPVCRICWQARVLEDGDKSSSKCGTVCFLRAWARARVPALALALALALVQREPLPVLLAVMLLAWVLASTRMKLGQTAGFSEGHTQSTVCWI